MLQKRTRTKEMRKPQKLYQVLSLAIVLVTYVIPGLDYRFHWSEIPVWLVGAATAVMLISYLGFFAVMVQNSYASRVIEIQEGQKLIDTGLYSVVRHPMYLCGTFLYLASPLVLGSYYGLIPALFIPVVLVIRIINEEKMLKTELKGYEDFMKKVRYRIIPFIW